MMSTFFSWMTGGPSEAAGTSFADFVWGLCWGFLAGVALALLILVLLWARRRRGHSRGVLIAEDAGDLFITVGAVREFVAGIVAGHGEASLSGVVLSETRAGYVLTITLELLPDTAVVPLRDRLREQIVREAAARLGVKGPLKVNFIVRSLSASERRIARASRKSLGRAVPEPETDGIVSGEDETEVGTGDGL